MKVTKSQLKEWIRVSIHEALNESDIKDKIIKYKDKDGNDKEATVGGILKKGENHPAYKDAKSMVGDGGEEKKKGSTNINIDADPFGGDVGGPAHPNVPKKKEKWDSDKFDDFYDGTPDKDLKKNVDNISNAYLKSLAKFKKDGVEFADEEAASIKSDMIDDYIEKRFGLTRADDDHSEAYSKINDFVSDKEEEHGKEKMVRNAAGDMVPANTVAGHPDFKKDDKPHPGERDPSVRASREKPKRPEAMNDLDWDNEIEPYELEGWVQDNIKKIPPSLKGEVNKLVDRYEELYSEEDYDTAAVVQKKLDKYLTKYMGTSSRNESVKESVRTTVKEIKTWMKTLEENRYRKIVNADARRVSWLVNNDLAEDYDNMPKSIRKKWSKAAYGRERYLAKEFIKNRQGENKLRESIRNILKTII